MTCSGLELLSFIPTPHLMKLNVSYNSIRSINERSFRVLKKLKILIFTSNKISIIKMHYFEELNNLEILYMNDNPVMDVHTEVFLHNAKLFFFRSDWYMVCCTAIYVMDCQPQSSFVSSCSSLFEGITEKVAIFLQGVTATMANSISLFSRLFYHTSTADKVLMVSLTGADLLMGLYLCLLAGVDFYTDGTFHLIITQWTKNYICIGASLLNFVSSHVSLMILMIMSVAQWRSVTRIGGLRNVKKRVIVGCFSSWTFILGIGLLYVMYLYVKGLRLRNNMCIIMAISNLENVSKFEYLFQWIVIVLDLCLLIIIFVSMLGLLSIISASSKSVQEMISSRSDITQKKTARAERRVVMLLVCNAICWLPLLTMYVLMLIGIQIHENVLVWFTIVLLPICATTDLLLYNIGKFRKRKN